MSSCTHSTRSAEQRWPALLNADWTASMTTCSGSAELSTIIAFWPPVSAISVRDRAVAAGERAVDDPCRVRGTGEGDARDARIGHRGRADDGAVAGQEMQHLRRNARLQHQADRVRGHQRGLLGRLRQHGIAGGQCRSDLAREDRQREIPRADAGEHAAAVQAELVAFAGRTRQALRTGEHPSGPGGVVPQEVDGLAHFGDAVRHVLPASRTHMATQFRRALLEQVGALSSASPRSLAGAASQAGCAGTATSIARRTWSVVAFATLPTTST